jgi:hypothetical protein
MGEMCRGQVRTTVIFWPPYLILIQYKNPPQGVAKIRRRIDKEMAGSSPSSVFFSELLQNCHKQGMGKVLRGQVRTTIIRPPPLILLQYTNPPQGVNKM